MEIPIGPETILNSSWQPKKQGGKWRWILFDTDFGFALFTDRSTAVHQTLNFVTDSTTTVYWPNPQWSTLLFRRLNQKSNFPRQVYSNFSDIYNFCF